ncbi:hypothetical protein BCV70DRAFT_161602 [Testicularia cyperi]|uniref:pH-response regulator protein palC n=1 Tax=Testicularia cyperi TaxID=1882483 RepID=A0A317XQE6_9BASI|nr:hypothetical protein BCV70DRAFT_161602 [Testicularia cyperi]
MYVYELTTTGTISFGEFLITTDLVGQVSQTTELRARLRGILKEQRASVSLVGGGCVGGSGSASGSGGGGGSGSGSGASEGTAGSSTGPLTSHDWLPIIKAVEEYLPYLFAVFNSIQTDDLILRYEPVFSWRTCLSSPTLRGAQRIELVGLYYEICSTLLAYALVLSNFSASIVASLGEYERDRSLSDADRGVKNDRLKAAADTLCRAAGILAHLSSHLIPRWESHHGIPEGRPPELTRELTLALSKVCLAEAQALAIRKLLAPSLALATDTVTPGPPLPKSHPSPSLLAKLHLNVAEEFEAALSLARTVNDGKRVRTSAGASSGSSSGGGYRGTGSLGGGGAQADDLVPGKSGGGKKLFGRLKNLGSSSSSAGVGGTTTIGSASGVDKDLDLHSSFLRYLGVMAGFHRALAYKWLGVDAGESSNRIGEGISFFAMSQTALTSSTMKEGLVGLSKLKGGMSSSSHAGKHTRLDFAVVREQELKSVAHWLTSYRKLNDTVTFQPLIGESELRAKIPAGRAALLMKAYTPPQPAFGPGSAGYRSKDGTDALDADNLHRLGPDHPARSNLALADSTGPSSGAASAHGAQYAGAGAYY